MSYLFDATSERITGSFTSGYNPESSGFSICAWINCADWSTSNQGIVQLGVTALDFTDSISLFLGTTADSALLWARDSADQTSSASYTVTADKYANTWVMICGVWNSTTNRNIYIEETVTQTDQSTATRDVGTCLEIMLGNWSGGSGSYLNGYLAEVCMWNTALTTTDVEALQTGAETGPAPNTIQPGSVIGYWPLDADTSTHTNQGSDAGGLLTVNAATYSSDHPTIPKITSVSTDDVIGPTETDWVISGSGFGAD